MSFAQRIASTLTLYVSDNRASVSHALTVCRNIFGDFLRSACSGVTRDGLSMGDAEVIDHPEGSVLRRVTNQFGEKYESSPRESSLYAVIILLSS